MTLTPPSPDPSPPDDDLALRPLMLQFAAAIALLTVGGLGVVWALRPQLDAMGGLFVERFGAWGVALAFGIPDMTGLPFPPESITLLALSGGVSYWEATLAGTLGSLVGGFVGFLAARRARTVPWIATRMAARAASAERLVARHGVVALVAGALTPLPYSLIAWACGLLGMPVRTFLVVSLLRFPRVALYSLPLWWALQAGATAATAADHAGEQAAELAAR